MSAPTVERTRQQTARPATSRAEAARRAGSGREASGRAASGRAASDAVGRAYARKAGRARPATEATRTAAIDRSRFVLLVMGLLGSGLVASLWLSTSAAADSYRLDAANRATRDLSERSETLRSEIAAMRSAPALARAAHDLGMVPAPDVARLVAEPGGAVVVVGTPKAAYAPAPVMAPPPPAPAMPPAVPGQPGAGSVTNQPGAVTNQQGVVPSRPVGAPPVQGGQPAPAAQAGQGPATQRGAAGRPAPTRPSSSGSASSPVQPGSRSVGGNQP